MREKGKLREQARDKFGIDKRKGVDYSGEQ